MLRSFFIAIVLVVFLLPCCGHVLAQATYCFRSSDGKNLNLKFTLIDKDWMYGYVKYNMPEYGIVIRQKYNHTIESYNKPGMKEYMWEELHGDTVTGTYQFMLQDGVISDIIYTRTKDKQSFRFADNKLGLKDCECDW